jgi:hypothetical protein
MKFAYIFLPVIILFASCKDKNPLLPKVSGPSGEVLVVMPDALWKGKCGKELTNILTTTFEGLPQEEPMFDIIHSNENALGNLLRQHRNIIIVRIGNRYPEKKILVRKNLWADTQIVLSIIASSDNDFISLLKENKAKLLAAISDVERQRIITINKSISDRKINEKLSLTHNLKLAIPKSYRLDVDSSTFTWLSCEQRDIIQGILIYHYNYSDSMRFTKEFLIDKRNQVLKKFVSGEVDGSYMTTESLYPPLFKQYKLNKTELAYELRGLWKLQNGLAMGGPFISVSQLDKKRNRIVVVEGFVFAPAHKKRELLRQVEAIVLSLEIL